MGQTESLEIFPLKILRDLTQVSFLSIPTRPGATRPLFDLLERHNIPLRFVIEGCAGDYNRDLVICIDREAFTRVEPELEEVKLRIQPDEVVIRQPVAVVRVLGAHFDIRPGTSGMLFSALAKSGITVYSNATTITSSLCVIPDDQLRAAKRAIGWTFHIPEKKK